jgi:hypothetical protein
VKYPAPTVVQLVPKHGLKDCVLAALAAYLGKPYEEVVAAAGHVNRLIPRSGVTTNLEGEKIARRLGCPVTSVRDYDIDEDSGVLNVHYHVGSNQHVVLLLEGRIFELEDKPVTYWEPAAYLAAHGACAGTLTVRREHVKKGAGE